MNPLTRAQRRFKSACAFAQSDQNLRCLREEILLPLLSKLRSVTILIRPRGYKFFFLLNSAEHDIFSANKYENANNSWHFHIY